MFTISQSFQFTRQIPASSLSAIILACLVVFGGQPATAQLINLNFSRADLPYTGNTETSPATPGGPAGVWNNLTNAAANGPDSFETDAAAVLLSDGSLGPTLTFDTSSGTSSGINWNGTSLSFSTVDYTTAGGVYDVASLYESGIVNSGNATTGFRIKGLTPGTYEVYLVPIFRGSQAAGAKVDPAVSITIGLGNDTDARNQGDYTLTSTAISTFQSIDTRLTSWVVSTAGQTNAYNYIGATVSIDSPNRWLALLLSDSATTGPDRPGPSVIQLRLTTSSPVGTPHISSIIVSGSDVIISGTNGTPNGTFHALTSSDLQSPLGNWASVLTNTFDNGGNFSFTNSVSVSPAFYIIQQQP